MREKESGLEVAASCENNRREWKDLSNGEKFCFGLLYTNLVVAPAVNILIYTALAGASLYYSLK